MFQWIKGNVYHYRVPAHVKLAHGRPRRRDLYRPDRLQHKNPRGGKTEVTIYAIQDGLLIGAVIGVAYCSMADTFDPAVGEQLATARALRIREMAARNIQFCRTVYHGRIAELEADRDNLKRLVEDWTRISANRENVVIEQGKRIAELEEDRRRLQEIRESYNRRRIKDRDLIRDLVAEVDHLREKIGQRTQELLEAAAVTIGGDMLEQKRIAAVLGKWYAEDEVEHGNE